MGRHSKPGIPWNEIREKYELGHSAYSLGKEYKGIISKQGIQKRVDAENWKQGYNILAAATKTATKPQACSKIYDKESVIARILENVENGSPEYLAAQAEGINPSTLTKWKSTDDVLTNLLAQARSKRANKSISTIYKAADAKSFGS